VTGMVQYFPGASTLIVGPAVAALTTDAELGKRLWPLISRGATGSAVLEEALRNGLVRTPDLMVIEVCESQTRVVARGAHNAHLRAPDGNLHTCNGADVSTWTERVFEDALGGTVDAQAGPGLPIVIGMVLAGGFAWGGDSPAEMTSPAAAPLPTVAALPSKGLVRPMPGWFGEVAQAMKVSNSMMRLAPSSASSSS